jgi:hypothetical protein
MNMQIVWTTFTPAEAEKITTLNTVMQRDWRRRGFIPSAVGHARFDAFSLAQMWVMKLLSDRGVGPQLSKEVAGWCALGILFHALKDCEAYEGDHKRTFEWLPEDQRPRPDDAVAADLKRMCDEAGVPLPESVDTTWGIKSEWLRQRILQLGGARRVIPAPFFIWWADGSHVFHNRLDEAFANSSRDEACSGAVIVMDLDALAMRLLDRAGRALVHIEFPADETGALMEPTGCDAGDPLV